MKDGTSACRWRGGHSEAAVSATSRVSRRSVVEGRMPWWGLLAIASMAWLAMSCSAPLWPDEKPLDLPILQRWSGDYPVAQIDLLPQGQRQSRVGYLGDAETFERVWRALKPDTAVPVVDFGRHIVVFARNREFYNRTLIAKVVLTHGAAEVVAAETLSARPVEEKAAMALALVPRAGIAFIQAGKERVPVR